MDEVDKKVLNALNLKSLDLPARPIVEELRVQSYVNWLGEDSLQIWVILADDTRDEDLMGGNSSRINEAISDALLEAGVDLFPYTRFVIRSNIEKAGIEL